MGRLDFKSSETRSTCLVGSTPTLFRHRVNNPRDMKPDIPLEREVVLVGGGHAHVEVLRQIVMRAQPGTRFTLITRDVNTPYSGMLPGFLAGHYSFDECHIDLSPLARRAGARLFHNTVTGIDLKRRLVQCEGRPAVGFDYLSIDTGATPYDKDIDGQALGVPIKPVDSFLAGWENIERDILDAHLAQMTDQPKTRYIRTRLTRLSMKSFTFHNHSPSRDSDPFFYCTLVGQRIVMLHGFVKKTQKTPAKDLGIAKRRMAEVKKNEA